MFEVEDLRNYSQIPFVEKGRDLNGWDCWGLVIYIMGKHFGVEIPDVINEYHDTRQREVISGLSTAMKDNANMWLPIPKGQEKPGDIILLFIHRHPCHTGIVISPGLMIHCEERINTVIESYNNPMWSNRIEGFYRHQDLCV